MTAHFPTIPHSQKLTHRQSQAASGSLVGAAVADALGAPFEFQAPGTYVRTFPSPVRGGRGEMIGGGTFNWAPGEFTDDTQMALSLAEALLASGLEFHPETTWNHFRAWSAQAKDIGNTIRASLRGSDYSTAAQEAHERLGQSGGNGSVMRIAPIGIAGVRWGGDMTIAVARAQSDLTHFDDGAGWGAAFVAEVIRRLIVGATLAEAVEGLIDTMPEPHKSVYGEVLSPTWNPQMERRRGNGSVWICVAQAMWCVRNTSSFEDAVTTAVNLGDDADTVAAVTGSIAGALYGIQQIPSRWLAYVHGHVAQPQGQTKTYTSLDLQAISNRLVGKALQPEQRSDRAHGATSVHDAGVYAANLEGAAGASTEMAVVSLCRTGSRFRNHEFRREVYLIDKEGERNPSLGHAVEDAVSAVEHFLKEGREVVVHCHGGRSRTGLVLKAWYMRHHGVDEPAAHEWLEKTWPAYDPWNRSFREFLKNEWNKS